MTPNASDGWPRPFAVGVLAVGTSMSSPDRSAARLDLALDTYKLGYFLIDTIEIDHYGTGYLAAELLVSRTTPDIVIVQGPIDTDWLHALADRHSVTIHSCHEPTRITRITRDTLRERLRRRGGTEPKPTRPPT